MKKRLVLVCLLVMALLCACGRKETPTEDFVFEMVDGEIVITGYIGTDREIVIPDEINDRPVTVIAEEAFMEYDMLSITFPKHLRVIETNAFAACNCLTTLSFPESLEEIEDGAFWNCEKLTEVTLPNGLAYLGEDSFGDCDSLVSLEIPDNFDGFKIEIRIDSVEVTDEGRREIYREMLISPVSDHTVLLIKEGSQAQKLLDLYGDGKVNYLLVDGEEIDEKDVVVYLMKEKRVYNSENVMTERIWYTYDESGNMLTEEIDYSELTKTWNDELGVYEYIQGEVDGSIDRINRWTYDVFNNMLTQTREFSEGGTDLYLNFEYTYKNGLPTKRTVPNNSEDYTEYYYNNGQLVRQLEYMREYEEPLTISFEYNSDGTLGEILWNSSIFDFSYNDQSELIELTRIYEGSQKFRNIYEYDSEGRMIVKELYNSDNELEQRNEYFYSRDGLLEEERIMSVNYGEVVYTTVKYAYEKVKMPEDTANGYYAKGQWLWLMEQTGIDCLLRK